MLCYLTMKPATINTGVYQFAMACAAALVLVLAWVAWSLLLAPGERVVAEAGGGDGQGGVSMVEQQEEKRGVARRDAERRSEGGAAPPVMAARIGLEELKKALVGDGAVPGEVLLIFRSAEDLAAFRARAGLYGLKILSADARLLAARVGYSDLGQLAKELNEHPNAYENVAANLVARIPGLPRQVPQVDANNQGGLAPFQETALASIGASGNRSKWGRSVKVAVLDSGIGDHETFEGVKIEHVKLVEAGPEANGHGTSMASLIGGQKAPAEGVAQGATLLDVWVADEKGMSNTALVASGIMAAVDEGAQVINISLGSFGSSMMLQNAVQYALNQNVLIVAAAGNEQLTQLAYPAAYPGVISVGAVDAQRKQAYFSNSGSNLTLVAPGVGILSAYPEGKVVIGSGTSQATAMTTGTVAAMLGWGYHPKEVIKLLTQNAVATGAPKEQVGAGFLQVPKR
jgi:thermitase